MKYKVGDRVKKIKGSSWQGIIVGTYSTEMTPIGYAVESERAKSSSQTTDSRPEPFYRVYNI